MNRMTAIDPAHASGKTKDLLHAVQQKLGVTPNMMRTMAASPAVLEGYLNFMGALGEGALDAKVREQIALAVADANSCDYCLAAHCAIGKMVGLVEEELSSARSSEARNPKTRAILKLARAIVEQRGEISDGEYRAAQDAGLNEGEIAEVIANVALNIFTNYFNHVARTEVDFPAAEPTATVS